MSIATGPNLNDQRFLLHEVSWDFYEHLLAELGDRPIRVTYDRGKLELMAPSYRHENYGRTLGRLVFVLCEELDVGVKDGGSTTFRREDLDRGLEPDDCFYIAHVDAILGKTKIDLTVDPPPDLAIEIDIESSSVNRLGIYAALGVPEVWRFDGQSLDVLCLRPGRKYVRVKSSPTFPAVPLERIAGFLERSTNMDDVQLLRSFRAWLRQEVLPRRKKKP